MVQNPGSSERFIVIKFLRDNWIWIVAPIVVVLVGIFLFYWLGDDPGASPFQYPAF